jgi:hypothetical protein
MLKKAQISLFIVIGIILVIVGSFFVLNDNFTLFFSPNEQYNGQIREIIETCTMDSLENGIFFLEFNGGRLKNSDNSLLSDNPFSIETWDSELQNAPTIESMQEELSEYIKENSKGCILSGLDKLSQAMNLNYDYDNQFSIKTTIKDHLVEVIMDFPIEYSIPNADIQSSIDTFKINKDSSLGDLFSLAIEIYNLEAKTNIFEEKVIDQIGSAIDFSDSKSSMPSQGISFSCSPRVWTKTQLKETLANLNNNNFKYLEFKGTKSKQELLDINVDTQDYKDFFRKQYVVDLPNKKSTYENYDVQVVMPSTQITGETSFLKKFPYRTFEITPSNGEIVKSIVSKTGGIVKFGCIQILAHSYTLDYDLIVMLKDQSDIDSEDFFNFPIRVQIERNQPKKNTNTILRTKEPLTATSEKFCSEQERIYPVEIEVQDFDTGDVLNNVNVTFKCVQLSCNLGSTKKSFFNQNNLQFEYGQPKLKTKVGYCFNGKFEAEKKGYFQVFNTERFPGSSRPISTITETDPYSTILYMVPTKTFTFDSSMFSGYSITSCKPAPKRTAKVYVSIENPTIGFYTQAFYSPGENLPEEYTQIELPVQDDIAYNVSMFYMINDKPYGVYEVENWKPDVYNLHQLYFNVPLSSKELNSDTFMPYFEGIKDIEGSFKGCDGLMPRPFGIIEQ